MTTPRVSYQGEASLPLSHPQLATGLDTACASTGHILLTDHFARDSTCPMDQPDE